MTVPVGCSGSNEATKIDASNYEPDTDYESEETPDE
jgi:hypothetical protein